MTHGDLVERARAWLCATRGCRLVLTEPGANWVSGVSPDVIGWKSNGWSILVECKISRSDFLRDKRKPYRLRGQDTPGCERWYLVAKGVAAADDMPPGWGLLEFSGKRLRKVHECAPMLRTTPNVDQLAKSPEGRTMTVERWRSEAPLLIAAAASQGGHDVIARLEKRLRVMTRDRDSFLNREAAE